MLAHDRRGSGPPLVLLHGLGSRRQVWDPLLTELTRHYEVITVDLPGFGESALWPTPADPIPRADQDPRGSPGGPDSPGRPDHPAGPAQAAPGHPASDSRPVPRRPPAPADQAIHQPPGPDDRAVHHRPPVPADRAELRAATFPFHLARPGAPVEPGHTPATPAHPPAPEAVVPGSVDHLADQVAAFLDQLGLVRPDIAGSSLGGGIALELGRRGRAGAVTAFAPIGFWSPLGRRWCQAVVGAARVVSFALAPALPRLLRTRIGRTALCAVFYGRPGELSPEDCLASARALARAPGFTAARRAFGVWRLPVGADPGALTGIPVTIAWGTRDVVLPYRRPSARARDELPAARHVLLPGCGHLPFADAPDRCTELLTVRQ
jgi:pimeloyl-ACP methyl ester carboxylesterase